MRVINALVALFIESGPVGYASVEETNMYVVVMIRRVHPLAAAVVRLEAEVWGGRDALTGREIRALLHV